MVQLQFRKDFGQGSIRRRFGRLSGAIAQPADRFDPVAPPRNACGADGMGEDPMDASLPGAPAPVPVSAPPSPTGLTPPDGHPPDAPHGAPPPLVRPAVPDTIGATQLRDLTYGLAHDLKAPLNTVEMLLAELYAAHLSGDDHDVQLLHGLCGDSLRRMRETIDATLAEARADGAVAPAALGTVPLSPLIRDVCDDLARDIAATGAVVRLPADLPCVSGERALLRLLFQNLLANALKYRHPDRDPEVTIGVSGHDPLRGLVKVTVQDNGSGIPPGWEERIFRQFQRAHCHRTLPGHGLGLTQCRRIAERHGGAISATRLRAGSCFTLLLPEGPR